MKDYIYMGNRLLAEYKPQESEMYFYTPDQINSTRIVTDETGTVVYSAAHDPYGGMQKTWVNTYDPTPKFSGKERDGDAESGLDYFGARYYDKEQYRFISVDPVVSPEAIGDPQRWNLYAYCGSNPVIYFDPDGRSYLVYDGHRLTLYSANDRKVGEWDASNTVVSGPHYAFPNGTWDCNGAYQSNGRKNCESFGPNGYLGFTVYTDCYGTDYDMCVHGGGADRTWESSTFGCIRTTNFAMDFIMYYDMFDPVEYIIIIITGEQEKAK